MDTLDAVRDLIKKRLDDVSELASITDIPGTPAEQRSIGLETETGALFVVTIEIA